MLTKSQLEEILGDAYKDDIRKDAKIFIRACNDYMGDCNKYSVHMNKSIEEIDHLENAIRYGETKLLTTKHILKSSWCYRKMDICLKKSTLHKLLNLLYDDLKEYIEETVIPIVKVLRESEYDDKRN